MTAYVYGGKESAQAELDRIHAAKEEARRELKERRDLLANIRRAQKHLEEIHADTKTLDDEIRHLAAHAPQLPPPRYGGPAGLRAAAKEVERYESRKRQELRTAA